MLEFVRARAEVHPREVDDHFAHGTVTNYWGGSSNATTHLLDLMHYSGLLRVARRESGVRVYSAREPVPSPVDKAERDARLDRLIDVAVGKYAPLPGASLSNLVARLRAGVPQWRRELKPGTGARTDAARARPPRWHRLVLAISRTSHDRRAFRDGAAAGAVRSRGVGSTPLRASLGLGVPLRSLHASEKTHPRILRVAAPVARSRHRLGQRVCRRRGIEGGHRLPRRPACARSRLSSGARSGARTAAPVSRVKRSALVKPLCEPSRRMASRQICRMETCEALIQCLDRLPRNRLLRDARSRSTARAIPSAPAHGSRGRSTSWAVAARADWALAPRSMGV